MSNQTSQERFKTFKGVFDEHTERALFELHSHNHFDELLSPIRVGKESNIFLASKKKKIIIVKIYRLQNCDFTKMFHYIRQDPRYEYLQQHRRQIIFAWTQREYKNLLRAQKAGIYCPKPLAVQDNILIEEMIGDIEPAPPLKDLPPKDPAKFFQECVKSMRKLYQAGLVHGDLSSFNILNHNEKPCFIDFSQGTLTKTPNAMELLQRDVKNITNFFARRGVEADPEQVLAKITSNS